jgi:hypothetical protein
VENGMKYKIKNAQNPPESVSQSPFRISIIHLHRGNTIGHNDQQITTTLAAPYIPFPYRYHQCRETFFFSSGCPFTRVSPHKNLPSRIIHQSVTQTHYNFRSIFEHHDPLWSLCVGALVASRFCLIVPRRP